MASADPPVACQRLGSSSESFELEAGEVVTMIVEHDGDTPLNANLLPLD